MGIPGLPQLNIPGMGTSAASGPGANGGNNSLFNVLGNGGGGSNPMTSFGLPGMGAPASSANASPMGGIPGMSSEVAGLVSMLGTMMGGLMAMIGALLMGLANGSISGKAPAGSGGSGGSGGSMATSASAGGGGGGSQPTGPVAPGTEALLARANSMVGLNEYKDTAEIQKVTKMDPRGDSGAWCAAWAMNLLDQHGVMDLKGLSNRNYTPTIQAWAKKNGIWGEKGQYTPKPGDAIEFDWEGDGTVDHIGIVERVEGGKVYTIEGNSSDAVSKRNYELGSSDIAGYIISGKDHPGKSA